MAFDAVAYKATTKQQWDEAAEAWHRWGPDAGGVARRVHRGDARRRGVGPGSRVLDVAGGAGGQALAAARRTGPTGSVVVTDLSPAILAYAERAAAEAGLRHVTTAEIDGEELGSQWSQEFDAVICRLGLNYFPDQARALLGIRSSLREGGRFAAIVYSTADRNAFFSVPVALIRDVRRPRRAGSPASRAPSASATPPRARDLLIAAGFRDVQRPDPQRTPAAALGRGLRPLREGVVRRASPDAVGRPRRRAATGLGRHRGGAGRVRDRRRVRRAPASCTCCRGHDEDGRFTVAAVQAAYVLLDRDATLTRVEELVAEAAGLGAELVVLPEAFVPGTPLWIDSGRIWDGDGPWYARLVEQAVVVPGPATVGASVPPLAPTGSTWSSACRSASRTGPPSTTPCCTSAPTGDCSASTASWCRPVPNAPSGVRATGRPWRSCPRPSAGSAASSAGRTTCPWPASTSTPKASRCGWRRPSPAATAGWPRCGTSPARAGSGSSVSTRACGATRSPPTFPTIDRIAPDPDPGDGDWIEPGNTVICDPSGQPRRRPAATRRRHPHRRDRPLPGSRATPAVRPGRPLPPARRVPAERRHQAAAGSHRRQERS